MQVNNFQLPIFRSANFDLYPRQELIDTLLKWLKEHKKNRKDPAWNSLIFTLANFIMPDVQISQLLISQQFFFDKIFHLLGLGTFRAQTLFNGVQINLGQTFIAFDNACKLQKVLVEGAQIKQVSPTQGFTMIKRQDLACEDRKQKLFIYNRQKNKNTNFLTLQLKILERTKNELFKQDHLNKMKFFSDFIFGESCPSFCVSGINMKEIKENEWLDQKTYLKSKSIFVIYSGTFVGFIQNSEPTNDGNEQKANEMKPPRAFSANLSRRPLSTARSSSHAQDFISKIQLNKGSIIESSSFQNILAQTNQASTHNFQSCKAICNSVIFEIKSSQFYRALCTDERCMQYFMSQYQKVFFSRKLIFSQSLSTLNKFFALNQQQRNSTEYEFGISRRKSYKGFRSKRDTKQKKDFEEMQNLNAVVIYDTMIRNKQKLLSLQKGYAERNKSSKQKTGFRYEDTKKLKENYKRMKIKDFHIQKLVFRNSVSNIKDPDGFKNVKSRFGQVKGMFQDDLQQVQKAIGLQDKESMYVQSNKQNKSSSLLKRQEKKLKSYSPYTSSKQIYFKQNSKQPYTSKQIYFKQNINQRKTYVTTKRVSLNQDILSGRFNQMNNEINCKSEDITNPTKMSLSTIAIDFKTTKWNSPSMCELVAEEDEEMKGLQGGLKAGQGTREGKKVKTFVKHGRKQSRFKPCFDMTVKQFAV